MRTKLVLALLVCSSIASANSPTQIVGQVVDVKHVPLEGVTVQAGTYITHTNGRGLYRIEVVPGDYAISFEWGNLHSVGAALVAEGDTAVADGKLDIDIGEVIHVHDKLVKPVAPQPITDTGILPPYSKAAIEHDTWARAWVFLDIDETGTVQRVKWLKKPGHDLEQIALETAVATKFTPARDNHDRPTRSFLVHLIEWPSFWWVQTFEGVTTHRPVARAMPADSPMAPDADTDPGMLRHDPADSVPCRGSGPLNLDSAHPTYKDCTPPPDPKQFKTVPWMSAAAFRH